MSSPVYYRVYLTSEDLVAVVCMQDFDEYDYYQDNFFRTKDGKRLKFKTEAAAKQWVNNNIQREKIHPDDRNHGFNQQDYMK